MLLEIRKCLHRFATAKTINDPILQDQLRVLINEILVFHYSKQNKITEQLTSWAEIKKGNPYTIYFYCS